MDFKAWNVGKKIISSKEADENEIIDNSFKITFKFVKTRNFHIQSKVFSQNGHIEILQKQKNYVKRKINESLEFIVAKLITGKIPDMIVVY